MQKYVEIVKRYGQSFQLRPVLPYSLWIIEQLQFIDRFPFIYEQLHFRMTALYGRRNSKPYTMLFLAQLFAFELVIIIFSLFLYMMTAGDIGMIIFSAVLLALLPLLQVKDLDKKIQRKRQAILMDLPIKLNQLILLINAGETLQQAFIRIGNKAKSESSPLDSEFKLVAQKLHNRAPLSQALEEMNKNCGVQEVSMFINALLLNYRRGGGELISILSTLSHQLWETRKNTAKTLGEEASSKLVFPMVIVFIIVLVVVSTPAIQMMN